MLRPSERALRSTGISGYLSVLSPAVCSQQVCGDGPHPSSGAGSQIASACQRTGPLLHSRQMSRVSRPRRPAARKPFAPSFAASGLAKPASEVPEAGEQSTEPSTASEEIAPVESKASEAQANKYTVKNELGETVALMAEEQTGSMSFIGRQLLGRYRSFTATVFDPSGAQVLFKLRRPASIMSVLYIETGDGAPVGEIRRVFSIWNRKYELFRADTQGEVMQQFASIVGAPLTWEFELKSASDQTLALIDRNFSGFAKELFTDAGMYVVHFGSSAEAAAQEVQRLEAAKAEAAATPPAPGQPAPSATSSTDTGSAGTGNAGTAVPPAAAVVPPAGGAETGSVTVPQVVPLQTDSNVIVSSTGAQLVVGRPLQLEERMIALACAVTVDFDFFSQHSAGGGAGGGMFMPFPMMGGYGSSTEGGAAPDPEAGDASDGSTGTGGGFSGGDSGGGASPGHEQSWMDDDEDDDGGGGGGDDDGGGGGFFETLSQFASTLDSDQ